MNFPAEKRDAGLMRAMFGAIAPRYDFITRVFSYGMDQRWKRLAARRASLTSGSVVLDLACGTGATSPNGLGGFPGQAKVVAVDLTLPMLSLARQRSRAEVVCGNAMVLPFADGAFDCVFVGYGLRNFPDLTRALAEIDRVTRPGGSLVTLDFFLPAHKLWRGLYLGYLYALGAFWGTLLHGRAEACTPTSLNSVRSFVHMQDFSLLLRRMGYAQVDTRPYWGGGIGLHWAVKS